MFASLTKTASHANASIDTFRDARAAIQMMARDLSAVVAAKPGAYFAIDTDSAGSQGAAIRQLEAIVSVKPSKPSGSPTPSPGDMCAVRYYCAWDGNARTYTLRRFFRDSRSTAQLFQSLYTGSGYADVSNLYCANVTNCTTAPTADEALAAYVWSLRVTGYDSSGKIINPTTDVAGYQTTDAANIQYICDPNGSTNQLPVALEISFKAMSPVAARTVMAATVSHPTPYNVWLAGDNGSATKASDLQLYNRLIAPNTYVFRTRIVLH
jgi:hypothetical protein